MIQFLHHHNIDKAKWDRAIENSLFPTLFAHYDYLSLVSSEWGALIRGDYEIVMPLPIRTKLFIKYIFTPFQFCRLGIFSSNQLLPHDILQFVEAIPKKFKQIDLKFHPFNSIAQVEQKSINFISHQLDLNQPYPNLYKEFHKNTKRNIKRADEFHLRVTSEVTIEEIIKLFQENRGKSREFSAKKRDYSLFQAVANFAQQENNLELYGVMDEDGELIAGACFLIDYDRSWFWFSGRNTQKAEQRAMFFLINEYIKEKAEQPLTLDFDGSLNEHISRFYKGFGATPYNYPMLYFSRDFYLNKLIQIYKTVRDKKSYLK